MTPLNAPRVKAKFFSNTLTTATVPVGILGSSMCITISIEIEIIYLLVVFRYWKKQNSRIDTPHNYRLQNNYLEATQLLFFKSVAQVRFVV